MRLDINPEQIDTLAEINQHEGTTLSLQSIGSSVGGIEVETTGGTEYLIFADGAMWEARDDSWVAVEYRDGKLQRRAGVEPLPF